MFSTNRKIISLILVVILATSAAGCSSTNGENESTDVESDIKLVLAEQLYGGIIYHFRISMSQNAAETLANVLDESVTLEAVIATLKALWKNPEKYELEILALLIMAEAYIFKETLKQNMGMNGVFIDVWGLSKKGTPGFSLCLSKLTQPIENLDYCVVVYADIQPNSLPRIGAKGVVVVTVPVDYELKLSKAIESFKKANETVQIVSAVINTVGFNYAITPRE